MPLHLVVLVVAMAMITQSVTAQDATPIVDIPPPELCEASPRSFAELSAILGTPVARVATDATPTPVPAGQPADAETIAGISATIRELVACFNAGEVLQVYGLYTDDYLRRIFSSQDPLTTAAYDALATPYPADSDEHSALLSIDDVRQFDDASVGAYVTIDYALIPVPKTFFFTFVHQDERWLIDGALGEINFSLP